MVAQVDERGYVGVLTPDADLRRSLFSDAVMRHPAKQHLPQLMHIARRLHDYGIEPMSNILDCFGGAGSAMLLCAPQNGGHNVVTIELAAHFRALQAKAWEHFACTLDMADIYDVPPGVFVSLAGDSREIPLVLFAANHDMEYYPPSDDIAATNRAAESYQTHKDQAQYHAEIAEIDRRHFARQELLARFAETGLREGEALDVVVTSPPYHNSLSDTSDQKQRRINKAVENGHEVFPYRVGRYSQVSLRNGYMDAVVTSPSYGGSEAVDKRKKQNTTIAAHGGGNLAKQGYASPVKGKRIDAVITSPPYHDAFSDKRDQSLIRTQKAAELGKRVGKQPKLQQYDSDVSNIGNESGSKYLASMAQVWQGAASVLRPGGILVCITRDCVKHGKRVPVGEQNRALIEAAGLVFVECETWKVDRLSFWRILQKRRNPDSPIIDSEEVMFFIKPEGA